MPDPTTTTVDLAALRRQALAHKEAGATLPLFVSPELMLALLDQLAGLEALCRRLAGWLKLCTPGYGYGYFPGGDPRDFTPDEEMCSPEEIARWEADCKAWNEGNGQPAPPSCYSNADGTLHILAPRYGLGSYTMRDPAIEAILAEAVRDAGGIDMPGDEEGGRDA